MGAPSCAATLVCVGVRAPVYSTQRATHQMRSLGLPVRAGGPLVLVWHAPWHRHLSVPPRHPGVAVWWSGPGGASLFSVCPCCA